MEPGRRNWSSRSAKPPQRLCQQCTALLLIVSIVTILVLENQRSAGVAPARAFDLVGVRLDQFWAATSEEAVLDLTGTEYALRQANASHLAQEAAGKVDVDSNSFGLGASAQRYQQERKVRFEKKRQSKLKDPQGRTGDMRAMAEEDRSGGRPSIVARDATANVKYSRAWCKAKIAASKSIGSSAVLQDIRHECFRQQVMRSCGQKTSPCKLVFSINTGRVGSNYVAQALGSAVNVTGLHEPGRNHGSLDICQTEPLHRSALFMGPMLQKLTQICGVLNGDCKIGPMHVGQNGGQTEQVACHVTGPEDCVIPCGDSGGADRDALLRSRPGNTYVETNPNWKAWMWEPTMYGLVDSDLKCDMYVLIIRRYIPDVVYSLYYQGWFTMHNGHVWMMTASSPNADIMPLDDERKLDAIDKIISYVINVEAFTQRLLNDPKWKDHPRVHFIEERAESLYTKEGMLSTIKKLGLEPSSRTYVLAGNRVEKAQTRHHAKKANKIGLEELSMEYCEQRVQRYIDLCRTKGIELPPLPQMKRYLS